MCAVPSPWDSVESAALFRVAPQPNLSARGCIRARACFREHTSCCQGQKEVAVVACSLGGRSGGALVMGDEPE